MHASSYDSRSMVCTGKKHIRDGRYSGKKSNLNAFIHEDISGMRVIQSFAAEKETQEEFDDLMKQHRDSFMAAVKIC